jgi:hypothetical protein
MEGASFSLPSIDETSKPLHFAVSACGSHAAVVYSGHTTAVFEVEADGNFLLLTTFPQPFETSGMAPLKGVSIVVQGTPTLLYNVHMRVHEVSMQGELLRTLPSAGYCACAQSDGEFLVTVEYASWRNFFVRRDYTSGTATKLFGIAGSGQHEMHMAMSLQLLSNGHYLVADSGNHCVKIFNSTTGAADTIIPCEASVKNPTTVLQGDGVIWVANAHGNWACFTQEASDWSMRTCGAIGAPVSPIWKPATCHLYRIRDKHVLWFSGECSAHVLE